MLSRSRSRIGPPDHLRYERGRFDVIGQLLRERGETLFYKVAVKPEKPILLSRLGNTIIVGLPGNPISTFVGYYLFVQPVPSCCKALNDHFPLPLLHLKESIGGGWISIRILRAHVDSDGDVTLSQKRKCSVEWSSALQQSFEHRMRR